MEINSPIIEKSDQIVWSSDDQGTGHVRTYTCTFCKRGFSNAQALGGHMNIHRKDRAKLKEDSNEDLLSVDITKKNPSDHSPASADDNSLLPESSNEEKSCTLKRPWILSREDDAIPRAKDGTGELRQLPLFVETPSAETNLKASSHAGGHEDKRMQLSHGSSGTELDLELRLGPEPH